MNVMALLGGIVYNNKILVKKCNINGNMEWNS